MNGSKRRNGPNSRPLSVRSRIETLAVNCSDAGVILARSERLSSLGEPVRRRTGCHAGHRASDGQIVAAVRAHPDGAWGASRRLFTVHGSFAVRFFGLLSLPGPGWAQKW